MSINLFVASGNLGNDIEVRTTQNGKYIGQFNIPVKRGWGDNEKTSWVKCVILGERAQKLQPYLTKGCKVTVQGEFQLEEWEKDGIKHSKPCIVVNNLELPPKPQGQQQAHQQAPQAAQTQYQQPPANSHPQQAPQQDNQHEEWGDVPF